MGFSHPSYICTYSIMHALFECECVLYCRIAGKQNFFLLASAISNSVILSICLIQATAASAKETPLQLRTRERESSSTSASAKESPLQLRPSRNRVFFNCGFRETESSSTAGLRETESSSNAASSKQSPSQLRPPMLCPLKILSS
jgi:hypothetical protein